MNTISIYLPALAGCLRAAGVKDVRYYLNGVMIDVDNRTMVGTDGHLMLAIGDSLTATDFKDSPAEFILDRDTCERILKDAKAYRLEEMGLLLAIKAGSIDVVDKVGYKLGENEQWFKTVDGRFPEWRRVVPERCSLELAQYDPNMVVRLHDAMRIACVKSKGSRFSTTLHHNGRASGVMTTGSSDRMVGVIMPWSTDPVGEMPSALHVARMPNKSINSLNKKEKAVAAKA